MSVISATTEDLASVADVIDLNHEFFEHIHDDELKSFRRSLVTPAATVYDGEDDIIHQHMVRKRTDVRPSKVNYQRPVSRGESVLLFKNLNDGDDEGYIDLVSSEMKDFIDTDFMMSEMYSRPVSRVTMISHNEPVRYKEHHKKFIPIIRNYQQTQKSLVSRDEKASRLCKVKTLETILENTKQTTVKKSVQDQKSPRSRTQTLNRYTATKTIPQRTSPQEQEQAPSRYTLKTLSQRTSPKEQASNRYTSKTIPQRILPKDQTLNLCTLKTIPQITLPKEKEQTFNVHTSKTMPQRALSKDQTLNRYTTKTIPQRTLPEERTKKPTMPQLIRPKRYEQQKDKPTTKSHLPTYKKSNLVQDRTPSHIRQADASKLASRPKFIPRARYDSTSSSSSSEEEQHHPYHIRQVSLPLKNHNDNFHDDPFVRSRHKSSTLSFIEPPRITVKRTPIPEERYKAINVHKPRTIAAEGLSVTESAMQVLAAVRERRKSSMMSENHRLRTGAAPKNAYTSRTTNNKCVTSYF